MHTFSDTVNAIIDSVPTNLWVALGDSIEAELAGGATVAELTAQYTQQLGENFDAFATIIALVSQS